MKQGVSYIFNVQDKSVQCLDHLPVDAQELTCERFAWLDIPSLSASDLEPWLVQAGLGDLEIADWRRHRETLGYVHRQKLLLQWVNCCWMEKGQLILAPLCILMTPSFIVTAHDRELVPVQQTRALCEESFRSVGKTPGFVFFLLWDQIMDSYLPLFAALDDRLDELEEMYLFGHSEHSVFEQIINCKRMIRQVKQNITPMQRIFRHLVNIKLDLISEESKKYLQGFYDDTDRLNNMLDVLQERSHTTLDGYNSLVSQQTNNSLRVLTIITTIMMPLSLLAAIYGTNFKYVPEFEWRYAYFAFWILLLLLAALMVYLLRRKKWI